MLGKLDDLPEIFQKKILIDSLVDQEKRKEVVDMYEYNKLRKQQKQIAQQCESYKKNRY